MQKIIKLSELDGLALPERLVRRFSADHLAESRRVLAASGLQYNNSNGRTRDNDGELSRLVNQSEHVPLESLQDVMEWAFSSWIGNGASRLERGFKSR